MQQTGNSSRATHSFGGWERLALFLIFSIGAWLRFHDIGSIENNLDEVYPIWQAIHILDTGHLPLLGQNTSALFPNPPLTGYLYVPFLAAFRSPVIVLLMTITLNTFAIWLVYRGLYWIVGTRPALLGTFLFATNPSVIEVSRLTWVQSLMVFFIALIFWALVPVFTGRTKRPARRLVIALVSLSIFANMYLLAYALSVPIGILVVSFWNRIPKRALVIGTLVFLLLMTFYFYGLYRDRNNIEQQVQSYESDEWHFTHEPVKNSVRLISGWDFAITHGQHAPIDDWEQRDRYSDWLNIFWAGMLTIGIAHTFYRAIFDSKRRAAAIMLTIWFFFPILAMVYFSQPVHLHYQLFGIPAGYAMIAWVLVPVLKYPPGVGFFAVILILTGAINGLGTIRYAQEGAANPSQRYPTLVLSDMIELGDIINKQRDDGAVVYTDTYEWTIMASAGKILPVTRTFSFNSQVIANDGSFYVYLEIPEHPPQDLLHAEKLDDEIQMENDRQIAFWEATQDFEIPNSVKIPSDIGVSFLGWNVMGELLPGATVEVRTYWYIDELSPDRLDWVFSPYVHILDSSSSRIANIHGDVIETFTWRKGDLLMYRINITIPHDSNGPFSINTGLFDSIRFTNAIFRMPLENGEFLFTPDISLPATTLQE